MPSTVYWILNAVYWRPRYWADALNWNDQIGHMQFIGSVGHYFTPGLLNPNRGKVTFVAFISFFPNVWFQMSPQIVCPNRGKNTLVAFIWFFPKVWFQMFTQIIWIRTGKVACIAFLFAQIELKSHLFHYLTFLHCVISNVFSNILNQNRHSCIDCIFVCTNRAKVTFIAFISTALAVLFTLVDSVV